MRYRISVDVGGTFTDVLVADEAGNLALGKGLTTRERIFRGIEAGLTVCAEAIGETGVRAVLASADLLVYGTTHATNAILEGKTAKTAFLVTEGFPDVLVLREGGKTSAYDFTVPYPQPYVPRRLTFEIRERLGSQGEVLLPLDEEHARCVLANLRRSGIEAIGVCLLWSIANPAHEAALGRLIAEELPGVPYTLSHELNPIIREYRRASSTVIDASLKPLMQKHLTEMDEDVRGAGFNGEILCAISAGGVMHVDAVAARPINAVRSGPALAPVAAMHYAEEVGADEVITCDTGGTSFDVSLVRDGLIKTTRETWLGEQWTGHMTGLSSVDVRSIGAGGGSVAWIDAGDLLRVGPRSAGADPGPACYGRGGEDATVTDAAVILGYIDPAYFLGGRMDLNVAAARQVVESLASQLGESVESTALAILTIASEAMVQAIQEITVNEGVDPRESLVVAGGGAAGLNIVAIARELGCKQVLIPRTAAVFSACGAQYSDIVAEFSLSKLAISSDFDYDAVNEALGSVSSTLHDFALILRSRGVREFQTDYFVEARYPTQVWELEVPLAKGSFDGARDVVAMVDSFHRVHERVFAVKEEAADVECLYWKGRLTGLLDRVEPPRPSANGKHASAEPETSRAAYFSGTGSIEIPIYFGRDLEPGMHIEGPAVIEEPTTTIVVYPGSSADLTPSGNYLIQID